MRTALLLSRAASIGVALCAAAFAPHATAQAYPAKPARIIVPFAAGGSSDVMARTVGKQLAEQMGAQFVVENRPGAGGNIALEGVAKSAGDGYTLLFGTIGTNGISPALFRNLPFDPVKDLAPISMLHQHPNVVVVNSALPINSVQELIGYAKANPGKLTFASAGNGSVSHLAGELLKSIAGIQLVHVPYKGGGAALPDLLAGNVSMMIETPANAISMIKSGKLRALAVTGAARWPSFPDLPTMMEAGVPGYQVDSWTGLFAPATTPRAIIERLQAELVKAARDPGYRQAMLAMGAESVSTTPDEFRAFLQGEVAKWGKAIQASGAKID
ncbi:MAG: tripartite tricarboxylate transporter substrate binding protein [Betaproteobacteria bacterium]|nr:tripartite tricarboxylate transporter substrate binding protein [Betaproteobacteria bacterium]